MEKEFKMFNWAELRFFNPKTMTNYKIIHVAYVYSDYSIDSDFESYSDELWETWSALMEAYKESKTNQTKEG